MNIFSQRDIQSLKIMIRLHLLTPLFGVFSVRFLLDKINE